MNTNSYDAAKDFVPLSVLASSPAVLAVHPSIPARMVRDLVQLAKTRPGALNYASAGAGTNHHIAGELLNYLAKIEITAIHYKGGVPGYDFTPWQIMLAPAGTPAAVVAQLNDHLVKAMRSPDIGERMARDGGDVIASSHAQAPKHVQSEVEKWRRVIKERGMRAE